MLAPNQRIDEMFSFASTVSLMHKPYKNAPLNTYKSLIVFVLIIFKCIVFELEKTSRSIKSCILLKEMYGNCNSKKHELLKQRHG